MQRSKHKGQKADWTGKRENYRLNLEISGKASWIIKGLSVLLALSGLVALADYLAGQFHRVPESAESLIGACHRIRGPMPAFVLADI